MIRLVSTSFSKVIAPVPKDKVELVRRGRAHIAADIRRMVERVEVIKGEPVKVIPRS